MIERTFEFIEDMKYYFSLASFKYFIPYLRNMKALILAENDFEDLELFYPYHRLKEEHIDVIIVSSKKEIKGKHGYVISADCSYEEITPEEYDILVIPGGRSPERVRLNNMAISITKHFLENNKPIATICHGVQVLISSNGVKDRKIACWYGVKDDLIAAGGEFVDGVFRDGNIVSARHPGDLAEWMRELVSYVKGN